MPTQALIELSGLLHDPMEISDPNPALLGLLQEAIRKKSRLGDVVNYVKDLLGQQPMRFGPLVAVIDDYQASRRIGEPER